MAERAETEKARRAAAEGTKAGRPRTKVARTTGGKGAAGELTDRDLKGVAGGLHHASEE